MTALASARSGIAALVATLLAISATPAFAQAATTPAKIDAADTGFMIIATGLVLIEIHRADADLRLLEVRRQHEDEIVRPHVTEQPHEAALVEFDQLFVDESVIGVAKVVSLDA